ncbi:hypothetical protein COO60DRAFT_1646853 [Scenedesmus sp. NREL 46B-D3]|nr:hypothetical protein COO60DRAFT_1646853 [Scenedesmus sp. NREL 46B-D3]
MATTPPPTYNDMLQTLHEEGEIVEAPEEEEQEPEAAGEPQQHCAEAYTEPPAARLTIMAPGAATKGHGRLCLANVCFAVRSNFKRYALIALIIVVLVMYGLPYLARLPRLGVDGTLTSTGLAVGVAGALAALAATDAIIPDSLG